jgi:glycosyltransferase involved in cell wall biosynthesis
LGTACHGLTRGLDEIGVSVCFVLPKTIPAGQSSHVDLRSSADLAGGRFGRARSERLVSREFEQVELHRVDAVLQPYGTPQGFEQAVRKMVEQQELIAAEEAAATFAGPPGAEPAAAVPATPRGSFAAGGGAHYAGDLMAQVHRYARLALELARREQFDVIHAHDWMTYPAALAVAAATHRPLVVHVHSTEFDRSGMHVNQQIYEIERTGMQGAGCVVCVSLLTRSVVTSRYGVDPGKCEVVYNAVDLPDAGQWQMQPIRQDEKIVLFLGRVTMQKGPEYFLRAAKKVVEKYQDVRFVVAGSGDMIAQCVREVAELGLGRYVTFTGFLRGDDVAKVFRMADLYVMPSVSEPFGIAPLEALSHNVPVIISRQSGVSEVLTHVLKVDFWDVNEMANKILAVLRHAPLRRTLRQHGHIELRKLSWTDSAAKLKTIYERLLAAANP